MQGKRTIYINGRFAAKSTTGVERYAQEITKAFDSLLCTGEIDYSQYRFVLAIPRNAQNVPELSCISVRQIGRLSGHLWEQVELPFYARDGVLFCPGNTGPAMLLLSGARTVITVHDLSYRYFPEAYNKSFRIAYSMLMPLVFHSAKRIITVSQSERSALIECYPRAASKIVAIQNGGLPSGIEVPLRDRDHGGPFILLYVGSLSKRKNYQGFLKAVELIREDVEVKALVVGAAGNIFQIEEAGAGAGLRGDVSFLGQVDSTERLVELYCQADCLVFPSFYEASPLPPIEAMACGCPVIASKIPSLIERCGDAALYCDPRDSLDVAQRIRQLASDPELRVRLSEAGRRRAREFSWTNCAFETWLAIKSVADGA